MGAGEVWELVKGKFCANADPCSHRLLPTKGSESRKVEAVYRGRVPKSENQSCEAAAEGQALPAPRGPGSGRPRGGEGARGYSRRYCTQSRRVGSEFPANCNVFVRIKL